MSYYSFFKKLRRTLLFSEPMQVTSQSRFIRIILLCVTIPASELIRPSMFVVVALLSAAGLDAWVILLMCFLSLFFSLFPDYCQYLQNGQWGFALFWSLHLMVNGGTAIKLSLSLKWDSRHMVLNMVPCTKMKNDASKELLRKHIGDVTGFLAWQKSQQWYILIIHLLLLHISPLFVFFFVIVPWLIVFYSFKSLHVLHCPKMWLLKTAFGPSSNVSNTSIKESQNQKKKKRSKENRWPF